MKRFWKDVSVIEADSGWGVALDGKPIRTQGGAAQVVPTRALADALAEEWSAQGDKVDPGVFVLRDLADFAIDQVRPDRAAAITRLSPTRRRTPFAIAPTPTSRFTAASSNYGSRWSQHLKVATGCVSNASAA